MPFYLPTFAEQADDLQDLRGKPIFRSQFLSALGQQIRAVLQHIVEDRCRQGNVVVHAQADEGGADLRGWVK